MSSWIGKQQSWWRLTFAGEKHQLQTLAVQEDRIYLGDNAQQAVHELNGRKLARLINRTLRAGETPTPLEVTLIAQ